MALVEFSLVTEIGDFIVTEDGYELAVTDIAAVVDGSQTTLACTTTGAIALGEIAPPEPEQPVAPGGPSRAAQRRLKKAIENRTRFEVERARRLAALTNDRPLFVTPPETVEMINEVLVEEIDHSVLFEDEDQDEELLALLMMV